MKHYMERHIELVRAVNEATTIAAHNDAILHLKAFRDALSGLQVHPDWLLADADCWYAMQGITRPMEGGVWLDWEPAPVPHSA